MTLVEFTLNTTFDAAAFRVIRCPIFTYFCSSSLTVGQPANFSALLNSQCAYSSLQWTWNPVIFRIHVIRFISSSLCPFACDRLFFFYRPIIDLCASGRTATTTTEACAHVSFYAHYNTAYSCLFACLSVAYPPILVCYLTVPSFRTLPPNKETVHISPSVCLAAL